MGLASIEYYHLPARPEEVVGLLTEHEDDAMIVNGGTFIHGLVTRGLISDVRHIIDINRLQLDYINYEADQLAIGSTTRYVQLEEDSRVQNDPALGALRDALRYPPRQIKNAASIGGCVASSCPFLDLPVGLLALDATAKVYGGQGTRDIPLDDFFISLFESSMADNEMLLELTVPLPNTRSASSFEKLETNANDLAILNAAVSVTVTGTTCAAIRIAIGGGVGETPARAVSAEAALSGQPLTDKNIREAAACARKDVVPLADHRASAEYRVAMAEALVRRCLQRAMERLGTT